MIRPANALWIDSSDNSRSDRFPPEADLSGNEDATVLAGDYCVPLLQSKPNRLTVEDVRVVDIHIWISAGSLDTGALEGPQHAVDPQWTPSLTDSVESNESTASLADLMDAVAEEALRMWRGNANAAEAYLNRPTPLLDGRTPHDLAEASCDGAERVLELLRATSRGLEETRQRASEFERKLSVSASIESVVSASRELWGDDSQADAFLDAEHPMLGGRTPRTLALESTEGAARVLRFIRQAQANTAV